MYKHPAVVVTASTVKAAINVNVPLYILHLDYL